MYSYGDYSSDLGAEGQDIESDMPAGIAIVD
jgi:hypothetical protein